MFPLGEIYKADKVCIMPNIRYYYFVPSEYMQKVQMSMKIITQKRYICNHLNNRYLCTQGQLSLVFGTNQMPLAEVPWINKEKNSQNENSREKKKIESMLTLTYNLISNSISEDLKQLVGIYNIRHQTDISSHRV